MAELIFIQGFTSRLFLKKPTCPPTQSPSNKGPI
jgi:hypothetical protein